jgi:predicted restriction endonuclease
MRSLLRGSDMALFITKPIIWNSLGYRRPSGVRVNSGFPKKFGFGHEEWNASPALAFKEDGVLHRVFHTERVGNSPVGAEAGKTFVFMYASHDGVQELVGVAGNATCLVGDKSQREHLTNRLHLDRLGAQAWAVQRVRDLHGGKRAHFDETWNADLAWIPTWRCPAETFLWLDNPAQIDPQTMRGTGKLLTMFGRYTGIDCKEALRMLEVVPRNARTSIWHRIRAEVEHDETATVAKDIGDLGQRPDLDKTTRKQLIDARLGQGRFRRDVEHLWGGGCAVSGCTMSEALRASHILAWKHSTDRQRLDGHNGLLLTADLDALFDRGLISFSNDGGMLVSKRLSNTDRKLFRLKRPLRKAITVGQRRYLSDHRRRWAFDLA